MDRNSILEFKNIPNLLTILRIIATPLLMVLLLTNKHTEILVVATIIIMLTDYLDGYLARRFKLESNFGKLMDPMADKILVFGFFTIFLIQVKIMLLTYLIILFREFLVSSIRLLALENKIIIAADKFGKIKTILQYILIILILISSNELFIYFLNGENNVKSLLLCIELVMAIMTVFSAINYTSQYFKTAGRMI